MILGASAGLAALVVACIVIVAIFGKSAVKTLVRIAAIVFLIWLGFLWMPVWLPYMQPIIDTIKEAWATATAGPR